MKVSKNIIILTQWSFKDPLIQAYTLPYVYIIADQIPEGSKIYLVTLEQDKLKMSPGEKAEVKKHLKEREIYLVDFPYSSSTIISFIVWVKSIIQLLSIILFRNVKYIHAWCTPAGSYGYILSMITGKPLIIDSYEPHAEAMVENHTWSKNGFKFKLLFFFERKLTKHAEIIISTTLGMYDYAKRKYGINIKNFFIKPACVNLNKFNISKRKNQDLIKELKLENKIVCVYAGKFGGIYLTGEVFDFFHEAEKFWGDKFQVLLLTSHEKKELINWAIKSNFNPEKMIIRFVSHQNIQDYLGVADFAITPVKPIPTKKYCTPIKDGEYWALGLPIVITKDISDDSDIIKKYNAGAIIENLSPDGYRASIEKINKLLEEPEELLSKRIENLAREYRGFRIAENIYRTIYG